MRKELHSSRRQALQERCINWSTHKVRHQRRWPRNPRRDSQRNLRQPRIFKDTNWQGFRAGFYWPMALADAKQLVQKCKVCQFFTKQQHVPAYKLVTIPPTWPFACWGLDMIGPLPTAPGGFNRVLVAIDKFTKWIEVKPVTCPKADRVLDFLDEIVHRYGFSNRIITDLGSNFNNHDFWEYCENSSIDVRYVSVAHPRANGQVKRANGMILDALKKRLHDVGNTKGGRWLKELPNALWGLRTQPCKTTGLSPYFLV